MTITKQDIANHLVDRMGLTFRDSKALAEVFFDQIRETLAQGEDVKLSGFGNFTLRDKPQRPGRNPKTGEPVPISARRVVTFHPSQKLKAACLGTAQEAED
ncbi:integration host factor subunit alpha [Candidatus Igneacidithiobacillus taiwanensis]|uniref:integration host factor subunit alpha n=1 Tax=Candidatus Igneacidithiobacillus taiwanensis TaxID=1945924 RepID=UPI00289D511C|nr:integration host factor subunit alpha [Candidatus Igneacidithiobacillus taiwanensis]